MIYRGRQVGYYWENSMMVGSQPSGVVKRIRLGEKSDGSSPHWEKSPIEKAWL